jgi:prolipoprotein diacylglyceryltransferase
LPFVLAGALIGGVTAGLWYAHQVSKTDDAMIDLSVPVVAIGTGVGAFGGFLVGEVVRAARSP